MSLIYFSASPPNTPFAPNFRIPVYEGFEQDPMLLSKLTMYLKDLELDIIKKETLVSAVPKSVIDPYPYTQQWKQHNLVDDTPRLGDTSNLVRFPPSPNIEKLFQAMRKHYLTYLKELGYERRKVWVHAWANILRKGEYISPHSHLQTGDGYLAGVFYVTQSSAKFVLDKEGTAMAIEPVAGKLIMFPSCLTHYSESLDSTAPRISIAFDIVVENVYNEHIMRPHRLLDDPDTMPGLEE